MDGDDVEKVRDETRCVVHPQRQLELFCVKCRWLICMHCKLSQHLHHESHTLDEAADLAADQLSDDKTWLETAIADLERNLEERRTDQRQFRDKKATVEREIRRCHSTLVAAADGYRDEALADLAASCSDTETAQSRIIDVVQAKLDELRWLRRNIVEAEKAGEGCRMVTVAKETKRLGHGRDDGQETPVTVPRLSEVRRPAHRSVMPEDDSVFDGMKSFIGGARLVEMKVAEPEVTAEERFRCDEDDNAVVFCVCPVRNGTVWVSFEPRYRQRKLACRSFSEKGEMLRTLRSLRKASAPVGRVSVKEVRGRDKIMFCGAEEDRPPSTYAKARAARLYKMVQQHDGKTYVGITQVLREQPELCTGQTDLFSICCGPHRAFDVTASGNLLAVVTEPQDDDVTRDVRGIVSRLVSRDVRGIVSRLARRDAFRDVKLYRRQRVDAVDTYTSPLTSFQPADVCFFTLRGREVSEEMLAFLIVSPERVYMQCACFLLSVFSCVRIFFNHSRVIASVLTLTHTNDIKLVARDVV